MKETKQIIEIEVIEHEGKKYRHISNFKVTRNTIKSWVRRSLNLGVQIDVVKLGNSWLIGEEHWKRFDKKSSK